MTTLSCNLINKYYKIGFSQRKRKHILKDVSFNVKSNEVFGIIGPNGAGKSSILKILMGFVRPDSGTTQIAGLPATSASGRKNLGYLPEHPSLYRHLSPKEHLQFACRIENIPRQETANKIKSALKTVALLDNINTPVERFSKGMIQRAALAYALVLNPKILILDEPMSGLDPLGRQLVIDIIQRYKQQGTTILFCSHILSDVERICDRIGIMNNGRLVSTTTPDNLQYNFSAKQHDVTKTPLEAYFLDVIKGQNP